MFDGGGRRKLAIDFEVSVVKDIPPPRRGRQKAEAYAAKAKLADKGRWLSVQASNVARIVGTPLFPVERSGKTWSLRPVELGAVPGLTYRPVPVGGGCPIATLAGTFRDPPLPTRKGEKRFAQRGGTATRQGWRHWDWAKSLEVRFVAGRIKLADLDDEVPLKRKRWRTKRPLRVAAQKARRGRRRAARRLGPRWPGA